MKVKEKGVLEQSEVFFHIPSAFAKKALFYILYTGIFFCNDHYHVERNDFGCYLLMHVKKGNLKIQYEGKTYNGTKNDLVLLNCHKPHLYSSSGDLTFEWIHFDGNSSSYYFNMFYEKFGCVIPLNNSIVIPECITKIMDSSKNSNIDEHFISYNLHKIFYEIHKISSASNDTVKNAMLNSLSYIEGNFNKTITLENLSQNANLSPFHFSRLFKNFTGYSPYEYLINYRINHAKTLLRNTNMSIKEIAFDSGFNSESHFATTFKKRIDLTPKEFRNIKF